MSAPTHVCVGVEPCRECQQREPKMWADFEVVELVLSMSADVDDCMLVRDVVNAVAEVPGIVLDGTPTADVMVDGTDNRIVTARVRVTDLRAVPPNRNDFPADASTPGDVANAVHELLLRCWGASSAWVIA